MKNKENYLKNKMKNKQNNNAEKACKDIYLAIHISQLNKEVDEVKRAWMIGQNLYNNKSPVKF